MVSALGVPAPLFTYCLFRLRIALDVNKRLSHGRCLERRYLNLALRFPHANSYFLSSQKGLALSIARLTSPRLHKMFLDQSATAQSASATVDSLLSEIEHEIPIHAKRQIPLQEIGDDTMEEIVRYNTRSNSSAAAVDPDTEPLHSLLENGNRKSVMFSDDFELHEYSAVDDAAAGSAPASPVVWDLAPLPQVRAGAGSARKTSLHLERDHSDTETDSEDQSLNETFQLGHAELRANTVSNMDERLAHVYDNHHSSLNVPRLKEMVNDIDQQANFQTTSEVHTQPLKITFESTRPLIDSSDDPQMLEFELQSRDSDDQAFTSAQHSPSKIPTTNTIRINRLSTAEPLTASGRLSSGSSVDESETDLETTMRQDKFQLLRTSAPPDLSKPLNAHSYHVSSRSLLSHNADNNSRAFSMATTADEFQSAKESISCDMSADESQSNYSVEDLQISTGMVREDDTLGSITQSMQSDIKHSHSLGASGADGYPPSLPPLNTSYVDRISKSGSTSTVKITSLQNLKGHISESDTERYDDEEAEQGKFSSSPGSDNENDEPIPFTRTSCHSSINRSSSAHSLSNTSAKDIELTNNSAEPLQKAEQTEPQSARDNSSEAADTASMHSGASASGIPNQLQDTRIVSNNFSKLFDEDAIFGDLEETSNDSIDITSSVKPSDYLSIWRSQEVNTKSSPTISANSQFSQQSSGTAGSSISMHSNFKLKPRIISRSRICYPPPKSENAFKLRDICSVPQASGIGILDPLRLKPKVSREISVDLKLASVTQSPRELSHDALQESTCVSRDADANTDNSEEPASRETNILTVEKNQPEEPMTPVKEKRVASVNLSLPDISGDNFDVSKELGDVLGTLNHDEMSLKQTSAGKNSDSLVYDIWDENNYQNGVELELDDQDEKQTKEIFNGGVLTKLLSQDSKAVDEDGEQRPKGGLGLLRNTDSDVAVCRADSIKGLDVIRSASSDSVQHSFEHFKQPHTPSPIKASHIDSPFKIVRARKLINNKVISPDSIAKTELSTEAASSEHDVSISGSNKTVVNEEREKESLFTADPALLEDLGKFYIFVKSIQKLRLEDIERHSPEVSLELDNGTHIVQTPWQPLKKEGIQVKQEFELIMKNEELGTTSQLVITVKCRYKRPQAELVEVIERIPIKKKVPFGKTKYTTNKKYVQKKLDFDAWDLKFAQDGSFARCTVPLRSDVLKQTSYTQKSYRFSLYNEWERQKNPSQQQAKLCELPRKPAYEVGEVTLEMCFLPRTSKHEKFPKTLKLAQDVVDKYNEQQRINFQGYLWQEGGDIDCLLQKRYFVLKGTQLVAHHEITKKPQALINLLKVVSVVGEGKITEDNIKKVRNFTDIVLFSECFKLIFENGEVINLDAESAELKSKWTELLTRVVELNKFHQPWVKHFSNNRAMDV
ncbi:Bud4p [Lachancea thermotolerans CBS 6340]|uniref:KLTH0F07480p n=1 Tax=Lachancea thermotolerans (strain ATCC 56472 / CBS 6340 / NRRL Y-8284) TaxID=559295 RepID=C5DKU0_LACTC|nr:KLTH0F07480p [Lachancea thermotolerans CBS 6340]CAR24091.1 KLTH0F07480p [Lachancea thermotolerans CBS 6340]